MKYIFTILLFLITASCYSQVFDAKYFVHQGDTLYYVTEKKVMNRRAPESVEVEISTRDSLTFDQLQNIVNRVADLDTTTRRSDELQLRLINLRAVERIDKRKVARAAIIQTRIDSSTILQRQ